MECIASVVSERFSNIHRGEQWHRHVQLINGRAAACQVYPPKLRTTILTGFRSQLEKDSRCYQDDVGSICREETIVNEHFNTDT